MTEPVTKPIAVLRAEMTRANNAWEASRTMMLVVAERWALVTTEPLFADERPTALRQLKAAALEMHAARVAYHVAGTAWYDAWVAAGCPVTIIVHTARCDDWGGLTLECERDGSEMRLTLAHHAPVPDAFDFSLCAFGPNAQALLDTLRAANGIAK